MAFPYNFVVCSPDKKHFEINGQPWYFSGANCYYLMTRAADLALRHEVTEVLDAAVTCGLTAIRTWAFCEGDEWNALQPKSGCFDERVFRGLDWVLAEAGKRGLKVMLVLVNHWSAYGGMPQYVKWSCERRGVPLPEKIDASTFYSDPYCRDTFQNFLATITSRTNTETGTLYRDDPTIMAWGLANEARCEGDYSGSKLQDWAASISEFMKALDPNHLLTLGSEGFLGGMTPDLLADNPYDCLNQGCDFVRNHSIEHIDFCSIHIWPDSWLTSADEEHKLDFSRRWINCHVDCAAELGKPLVITEFGKKPAGPVRAQFFEKILELIIEHAQAGEAIAGSLFWSASGSHYSDSDAFTVHLAPPAANQSTGDASGSRQPREGDSDSQSSDFAPSPSSVDPSDSASAVVSSKECPESKGASGSGIGASEGRQTHQKSSGTIWLDEQVVAVLKAHAKAIAALNSSWGECPLM